ncbi:MAG: CdvA-like protein [Candidatus Bathyarchaeia archaeon]
MISWKHTFKRLSEEYEMARKKKQALDNLLTTGRISPSTHELFNKEIDDAIAEIEKQQKALLDRMNSKIKEIESRIKTLEMLLANVEVQHVTGEIDEETYQREISLLPMGLEIARQELENVKEAVNKLSGGIQIPTAETVAQQKTETVPQPAPEAATQTDVETKPPENIETPTTEVAAVEEHVQEQTPEQAPETPTTEVSQPESFQNPQEQPQEAAQTPAEQPPTEAETKTTNEEKHET